MNHSFLILGANGQLGKQFYKDLTRRATTVIAPDEKDCDITSANVLSRYIDSVKPTVVINCAAYNAVDLAEQQPETAYRINTSSAGMIAALCAERKISFVHYSSDYVFDGAKGDRYSEQDVPNPLNVYGKSKHDGETAVLAAGGTSLVLRTSWVFGNGTQNFIYKMKQWSQMNPVLKLTADEVSVPTSTIDLVDITLRALNKGLSGLFHLTNSDYASRYEWGRYVAKQLSLSATIIPVPMSMFPSPAQRPLFSAMSNQRLQDDLGIVIPDWRDAVDRFIKEYPMR
ncbi:MAG: dTDP-4-dehydrorhamnose reductase [Bacteroidetes bacterium]|nr:dTDP-4-dehydrorhamnose reductase [Bacteroidota bacterium]